MLQREVYRLSKVSFGKIQYGGEITKKPLEF